MEFGIVWTKKAVETYAANIEYLKEDWSEKEIQNFLLLTKRKLEILRRFPNAGIAQSSDNKHVRCTVLHTRVKLIYRVNPIRREVELLLFWNTWQNPGKLKI